MIVELVNALSSEKKPDPGNISEVVVKTIILKKDVKTELEWVFNKCRWDGCFP